MENTTAVSTDVHAKPATVLGQKPPRIPRGGKIRAGIKVLTKAAAANPNVQQLYDEGIRANDSFEQIGKVIAQAFPDLRNPLVPKNVAWFTVRPNDFPNPQVAAQILDAYGEDRGDGVVRLYRFPVIFPADSWQSVMPHELVAWSANEKRYWSEYSPDGHVRHCMTHAPVKMDANSRRAVRLFGGRATQLRAENNGVCDTEQCKEFQSRQCNLSGRFLFYIPGIKSIDAFELGTNSFYAMSHAIERFEAIGFMRGGRVSGFLDNRQTTFFITKKLLDVTHIDESGKPVRSAHWIIELEAPIDVAAMLFQGDDDGALRHADTAARLLQGGEVLEEPPAVQTAPNGSRSSGRPQARPAVADASAPAAGAVPDADMERIAALAAGSGVDPRRHEAYADKRWGAGWRLNGSGRSRVIAELERYRNDPAGFKDKVDAALGQA